MKKILNQYKYVLFIFVIGFLCYAIRIIYPVVSIDTEAYINQTKLIIDSWYSIGRFSLGFYAFLFHLEPFNIVLSNLIAYFLFFISVVVLVNSLVKDQKLKIFFGLILITSPLYAEQYAFTLQNIGIFVSFLLLVVGILLINKVLIFKKSKLWLLIAIPFVVLSFGTYQSFYMLYISLVIMYFIYFYDKFISNTEKISIIIKYIIIFVGAAILTMIVGKLVNHFLNIESTGYLREQMNWFNGNFKKGILYSGYYACEVFFGLGIDNNLGFTIIFIFVMLYMYKNKKIDDKLLRICYIFLLVSPFLITIVFGTLTFNRAQFSIPIIMGFLYTKFFDNKKIYIISIILIIVQSISLVYLFYIDYQRFLLDKKIIVDVLDNIDEEKPIVFIHKGKIENNVVGEVLGKSFYGWDYKTDRLSNDRIHGFASAVDIHYMAPTLEQIIDAKSKSYHQYISDVGEYFVVDLDFYE